MKKTVLITGIAGFIGSNIARRLVAEDKYTVVGVDNFETGRHENLSDLLSKVEFIECDITEERFKSVCRNVDFILHEAAIPSVQRSIADPAKTNRANIIGTLSVLEAARTAGVKRVVYAASSSAYGDSSALPKMETMVANPMSPYAVQKLAGEYYCRCYTSCFGLSTISLRYFNVFGPHQDPKSVYAAVIPRFIQALRSDKSPVIFGDGEQSRDFTFIENVVEANIRAIESTLGSGEVVNIACGERVTVKNLFFKLRDLIGSKVEPEYQPRQKGDVLHSLADISKAAGLLNFKPIVSFDQGLSKTVSWFLKQE